MKRKHLLSLIPTMILMFSLSIPELAQAKKVKYSDGKVIYTLDTSTKTAAVTGYEDGYTSRKITIPDYILNAEDGISYKVTSIASKAFQSSFLSNISMPNTIETIGSYAFETCSFSKLTLPESVKTIGAYAFYNTIYNKTPIDLIIPSGCTAIKECAFNSCSIRSVRFNSKLTTLGGYSFANTDLTEAEIPASVTTLGDGVFVDCKDLTSVVIRRNLASIPRQMFEGCDKLTSVNIPASVTSINGWAFANCPALKQIQFPAGLKSIGEYAFYKSGLEVVNFPSGLQTLGEEAFSYIPTLQVVSIPASVTSIGNYCFESSSNLLTVKMQNPKPCLLGVCGFDSNTYSNALLWVPSGTEEAYRKAKEWWCFKNIFDPLTACISDTKTDHSKIKLEINGTIVLFKGIDGRGLQIMDMMGRIHLDTPSYRGEEIRLSPGVYLAVTEIGTLKFSI